MSRGASNSTGEDNASRIKTLICCLLVIGASFPATANPVTYGQQLCIMLKSGISQDQAWSYIAQEHTKSKVANSQTLIPWYSAASAGWALGTTLGNAELAQKEIAAMKPDVLKVARASCPKKFEAR